jgi:hypothetical protein
MGEGHEHRRRGSISNRGWPNRKIDGAKIDGTFVDFGIFRSTRVRKQPIHPLVIVQSLSGAWIE